MRDHPILYSASMVRAILANQKTKTRRLVRDAPADTIEVVPSLLAHHGELWDFRRHLDNPRAIRCPYGAPGDRLWVREAWQAFTVNGETGIAYRASCPGDAFDFVRPDAIERIQISRWRPGIHMPRRASRITLEVTRVRVERLQDITEADARAEGVAPFFVRFPEMSRDQRLTTGELAADAPHRASFAVLWDELNGDRAPWASNPLVWVVAFTRIEVPR